MIAKIWRKCWPGILGVLIGGAWPTYLSYYPPPKPPIIIDRPLS